METEKLRYYCALQGDPAKRDILQGYVMPADVARTFLWLCFPGEMPPTSPVQLERIEDWQDHAGQHYAAWVAKADGIEAKALLMLAQPNPETGLSVDAWLALPAQDLPTI